MRSDKLTELDEKITQHKRAIAELKDQRRKEKERLVAERDKGAAKAKGGRAK